jgi:hypothetical protein
VSMFFEAFQSDHPEDFADLRAGCGWINTPEELAQLPLSERTGIGILRETHREQRDAERERAARQELDESRALTHLRMGRARSHEEVLATVVRMGKLEDHRAEREARMRAAGIELDPEPFHPESYVADLRRRSEAEAFEARRPELEAEVARMRAAEARRRAEDVARYRAVNPFAAKWTAAFACGGR